MKLDFNGSELLMSARSPFARRVRLAFRESGIRHDERVIDVLKPTPEVLEKNPLARIPIVKLANGRLLIDSSVILPLFYEAHPSSLYPTALEPRLEILEWSTLAVGVSEKIVELFFDTQRKERDHELTAEVESIVERFLTKLEKALGSRATMLKSGLTQADLDLGTALRYLSLRYSTDWRAKFTGCARYSDELEKRPSFQATVPPPPA